MRGHLISEDALGACLHDDDSHAVLSCGESSFEEEKGRL